MITFDCYHDAPGCDRPGFGEEFFAEQNVTAIHLLSHGNDWFHYPDVDAALAVIRVAASGAERVFTYGSSMGGYGAIRFGAAVGADVTLALSPQYSIDPRRTPFERRWIDERRRIQFLPGREQTIVPAGTTIVAYDPTIPADRAHVDLIAREIAIDRLALPFGGHPVGPYLNEIGLLRPLVLGLLDGAVDLAGIRRQARCLRGRSASWLGELADRQPAARPRTGIALARMAVSAEPAHPMASHRLAIRLRTAGRFAEAIAAHERAMALDPSPTMKWDYSHTLFYAGDLPAALAAARALKAAVPNVAGYHRWAARLAIATGDLAAARNDLRAAIRQWPLNWSYRWWHLKIASRLLRARFRAPGRRTRPGSS